MKRIVCALAVASASMAASGWQPIEAVSVRQMSFDQMVTQASMIVRGRVLETRAFTRGTGVVRSGGTKIGVPPVTNQAPQGPAEPPQSAGTRGGRMIFTRVVLQLAETLKGAADQRVEFDVAGGTIDGRTAWIPGMPTFDRGADYILFLREGFEKSADPILGVRQGYFRVFNAADAGEVVLNADFDFVIGLEAGRVIPRLNPERGKLLGRERPVPQIAPLPTPDPGGQAPTMSAEARRYLTSTERPLTVAQFLESIRARLGR